MENTNNKSFVAQNSDKPFIRTMEDDLKKIKSSPAGKNGRASIISSLPSETSLPSTPVREVKRAAPAPVPTRPAPTPAPAPVFKPAPIPIVAPTPAIKPTPAPIAAPVIPKNLPIGDQLIGKKSETIKPAEKPISGMGVKAPSGRIPEEFSPVSKPAAQPVSKPFIAPAPRAIVPPPISSVAAPVSQPVVRPLAQPVAQPITPVSSGTFPRRAQGAGNLVDETEKLSPEARLARQSSFGVDGDEGGSRDGLITPSAARISANITGRQNGSAESPELTPLAALSFENRKKSIEEILKEDTSDSFFKKFMKAFFVFLVIAGVVVGGFYLYTYNKLINSTPSAATSAPSENYISDVTEIPVDADLNADLNNIIRAYFSNPIPAGIYRVVPKNRNGNSLSLEDLGKRLNITFPDSISGALEKDYNLIAFNYPEKNYLRLGLVLRPKKTFDVSAIAKNLEPNMYKNTESLFMGDSGIYDPRRQFGSNSRDNFAIRYLPLGNENTGLNYAIDSSKNYLLIATSKDDIFSLIDKSIKGK